MPVRGKRGVCDCGRACQHGQRGLSATVPVRGEQEDIEFGASVGCGFQGQRGILWAVC